MRKVWDSWLLAVCRVCGVAVIAPSFITASLQQFLWCSIVARLENLELSVCCFPVTVCRQGSSEPVGCPPQNSARCGFAWAAHSSQNICAGKCFFIWIAHAAAECIAASLSSRKTASTVMFTDPVQPLHCHCCHHQPHQSTGSETHSDQQFQLLPHHHY